MILLLGDLGETMILFYLIGHLPAFVLFIVGLLIKKQSPKEGKILLILAGIYFLIGAGVCSSFF